MKNNKTFDVGFTLIELLIVVIIIGIIAAITIPSLIKSRRAAEDIAMVSVVKEVDRAEGQFLATHSRFGSAGELFGDRLVNVKNDNPGGTPFVRGHYLYTNAADASGYRIHVFSPTDPTRRNYLLGYRADGGIIIYDSNLGWVLFEDVYGK